MLDRAVDVADVQQRVSELRRNGRDVTLVVDRLEELERRGERPYRAGLVTLERKDLAERPVGARDAEAFPEILGDRTRLRQELACLVETADERVRAREEIRPP